MKKYTKILLVVLAASMISGGLHFALTAKYADWVSADGVITDIQFHRSHGYRNHSSRYSYEISYTYTVDAVLYSGVNAYSGRDTDRTAGEAVTVWYDPAHPEDSSFHPPGPGLWPLVPFIIGVPIALRRLRQKERKGRKYGKTKR